MTDAILQTKLNIPLLRSNLVSRPRLTDKLNAGMDDRLILVSAQAGSGKTTLVREWLAQTKDPVTWISLDEADNDPRRFLLYLLAALRQINSGIGQAAEAMLRAPQLPPGEAILISLINELSRTESFLLVFDDYHVLHTPPIFEQMNFLLDHMPSHMRMVVISREDPPMPLPRLRARGELVEIRQQDLRFTLEECADFLNQVMGLNLSPADIAALERRTEGWVAGLQLAALSMRGRDDLSGFVEAFTGSSHYVLDYLIEEVFKGQQLDVQDFLLKTAILERLSGPLCDAVTGRVDSRALLERLEHANLFIVPLDEDRTWYRYHRLFADLLRQRLQVVGIYSEAELHHLASQWFEKSGFYAEAIQHSLAASDWERSASLIGSQTVVMLGRGELVTLLGWFISLPEEVIRSHPNLCRDYGWSLALTGQFDAAAPLLDCAERLSQNNKEQLGQVLVAQAYLARARGDNPRAVTLSKQALDLIAEKDILHRGLVTFTLGFALLGIGQLAEAEKVLVEACESTRSSGNDYARLTALGLLGSIQKNQGKLHRAAEYCRQAVQEARGSPTVAKTQVILASILYEWNDLDGAVEQLEQAHKACLAIRNLAILPEIYPLKARIKYARGDLTFVPEMLNNIQDTVREIESPVARAILAAVRVELALMQSDIPTASHWASQMTEGVDPAALGLLTGLMQARLLLAQGIPSAAGTLLAGMYESVAKKGLISSMIEVRAMQAVASKTPNDALGFLREALKMAQAEKFIRTFVDLGEPMKFLLERMKSEGGEVKEYVLTLLSAFGEEKVEGFKNQPLVEAMSEREMEILRLMSNGLSNRDIAERLVITVGTTKSHVHHILEKLGTESRTQAAARARELGLV